MPRCLITGASGFVGSNLARHLSAEGWDVRCLLRSTGRGLLQDCDVEMVQGSLSDSESLRQAAADVEFVFHVAGRVTALSSDQFAQDNVEGTRAIAEACAVQANPPQLVFVSSLAAGGPAEQTHPRVESDKPAPVSAYGWSKLRAENAAAQFASQTPISVVRPPIIFGPGDRAGLSMYRSMRWMRLHMNPGFREFPVSIIYVADLCEALRRVAVGGVRAQPTANGSGMDHRAIYYVSAERDVTYAELGRLGGLAAGWRVAVVPLPRLVFRMAGALGEAVGRARRRPALVNLDKIREAMAPGWVCSGGKIHDELQFSPAESLEHRFDETVAWYRQHGWL